MYKIVTVKFTKIPVKETIPLVGRIKAWDIVKRKHLWKFYKDQTNMLLNLHIDSN